MSEIIAILKTKRPMTNEKSVKSESMMSQKTIE